MAGDEDLPQSKYKYLGFPNGHAASAGHTGKSRPRSPPGSQSCWVRVWRWCHQLTLCIDPTPSSATACTGCSEHCTKCILGWKSNFSRQIRHTRTHINYRFWALIHEDRCRNHKFYCCFKSFTMASQNQCTSRPSIQNLLCLNKSEAAQNNKYSHVNAAQNFTLRRTLLALLSTNPSPGLLQSLHFFRIHFIKQIRALLLKWSPKPKGFAEKFLLAPFKESEQAKAFWPMSHISGLQEKCLWMPPTKMFFYKKLLAITLADKAWRTCHKRLLCSHSHHLHLHWWDQGQS